MSEPKTPGEFACTTPRDFESLRDAIAARDEMWRAECSQLARQANDLGRQIHDMERTHVSLARLREEFRRFFAVGRIGGRRPGRMLYSEEGERLAKRFGIDLNADAEGS